ncbi:MAG: deoxyribodipyrimidine photo-lyase, partial [Saprospiraceae bacterium]|nr:deoxyribodipyrimidine photo-lyase [Saprospiraceae bacterium]
MTLYWFRRDLRLEDNTGLFHALKSGNNIQPVFIFDTKILDKLSDKKDARVTFIHNTINHLDNDLKKHGSSLWVFYGSPEEVFRTLVDKHDISEVYANRDYESYALNRDKSIQSLLGEKNIPFHRFKDHVIFEGNEVLKKDGTPYTVFTP